MSSISPFGVFIDLGGADGLAHISELSWDRSKTPQDVVRVGDEVDAYVLRVDPETKRIALSLLPVADGITLALKRSDA